jgi:hypothetical protein
MATSSGGAPDPVARVKNVMITLGLPGRFEDVLSLELEQLIPVAGRLGLPDDQLSKLSELALVDARLGVQMELRRLRSRGVKLFRQQGHISTLELEALRRWTVVTSRDDPDRTLGDDASSQFGGSVSGSHAPSDSADNQALRRELDELRTKVSLLESERDQDEDPSASSARHLWISDQLWDELPPDAVRAELSKSQLRHILRVYPLPADYSLKAGEASASDRARLTGSARDQMDSLAKTVGRMTDPVRPLLHLISRLDNDEIEAAEIRRMALDSILLSLHGASSLEVRRKKLLFGENKVLGSLFDRTTAKPLLSEHEERALEELYKHEKHKAKIRAGTRPRPAGTSTQRPFTPAAGGNQQHTGVNFEGGPRGRGRGNKPFRQFDKTNGHVGGRGRGTGDVRGASDATAQRK